MSMVSLGIVAAGLILIGKLDPGTKILVTRRKWISIFAGCVAAGLPLGHVAGEEMFVDRLFFMVVWGCLLLACIMDMAICQVYNFVWWISGAAALALLWQGCLRDGNWESVGGKSLWGLILFGGLQLILFARMYGRADCYAFCVCAAVEAGLGMKLTDYLIHMLFAFGILLLVQAGRRNISRKGNLKRPVPFLPYITAAFYLLLLTK